MKIRVDDVKCPVNYSEEEFRLAVEDALRKTGTMCALPGKDFENVHILKKSLDARKKPDLWVVFSVEVSWDEPAEPHLPKSLFRVRETCETYESLERTGEKIKGNRPVVAGCGPAGLFAALTLALHGYQPVLIERGKTVHARIRDIMSFWENGTLLPESNVQFGEGGAGTFSDGKLTTRINNPSCRAVLETLVDAGAPEEILTMAKPHIGTDLLREIIGRIREKIEFFGGTVLFETKLTGLCIINDKITGIDITTKDGEITIETDSVILATGHSARDTIRMLSKNGVAMQAKPFSMGVRIEHFQKAINESQYGRQCPEIEKILPAADYKLSCHLPGGRDVYTFCMCPGGQVIASASGEQQVVTNGMSLFARTGENANSAILVNVDPSDYDSDSPLSGIDFQEKWEHRAFLAGGASYKAPAQYVGDFLNNAKNNANKTQKNYSSTLTPTSSRSASSSSSSPSSSSSSSSPSSSSSSSSPSPSPSSSSSSSSPSPSPSPSPSLPLSLSHSPALTSGRRVIPTYTPGVTWTNLSACLPIFVTDSIRLALPVFERKLSGFAAPGAVMTGIESRSSSPVRILRDSRRMASIEGIYPCGEGAGYAGGIMSAAVDGIASAVAYIEMNKSK